MTRSSTAFGRRPVVDAPEIRSESSPRSAKNSRRAPLRNAGQRLKLQKSEVVPGNRSERLWQQLRSRPYPRQAPSRSSGLALDPDLERFRSARSGTGSDRLAARRWRRSIRVRPVRTLITWGEGDADRTGVQRINLASLRTRISAMARLLKVSVVGWVGQIKLDQLDEAGPISASSTYAPTSSTCAKSRRSVGLCGKNGAAGHPLTNVHALRWGRG
jgi:hypothetical protein